MKNNFITKNTIIYEDCILDRITIFDLIEFLNKLYADSNHFEDVIKDILEKQNFDDKTICSLLTLNHVSGIKLIIDILNSLE